MPGLPGVPGAPGFKGKKLCSSDVGLELLPPSLESACNKQLQMALVFVAVFQRYYLLCSQYINSNTHIYFMRVSYLPSLMNVTIKINILLILLVETFV